ncbi:MAG TPA: glycosyltransferase [Candidatus Deferrimicrobiaceae bacterium]|nr:glycosyltransferase [Candidatus Deferrimicrobiaceae bacterium]
MRTSACGRSLPPGEVHHEHPDGDQHLHPPRRRGGPKRPGIHRRVPAARTPRRRRRPDLRGDPRKGNGRHPRPCGAELQRQRFLRPGPLVRESDFGIEDLPPHVVHSHHPFLLGDTALRVSASRDIPVVFTHHTMYEKYTHYVPGDSPRLKHFVVDLVTGYCNLCDAVVAPSGTVAEEIRRRGVKVRVEVIPTGVNRKVFSAGDGNAFRERMGIPADAFLVGHVGRLALEKNLGFLVAAVVRFLQREPKARFFLAGEGPIKKEIEKTFAAQGLSGRYHSRGVMDHPELASAYRGMDVFAFASHTETQGMVLTEAMAAGTPVVALDASGVREVVRDQENGRLLPREDLESFVSGLAWVAGLSAEERTRLGEGIAKTADEFSMEKTAEKTLALYESLVGRKPPRRTIEPSPWTAARNLIEEEWKIVRNIARAAGVAVMSMPREKKK